MEYKGSKYNYMIHNKEGDLLIMNMRTCNKIKIKKEKKDEVLQVLKNGVSENDINVRSMLISKSFLLPEDVDEAKMLQLQFNEMMYGTDTLYMNIMPTNDCNFRCSYCFETHEKKYMSEEAEKRILLFAEKKIAKCKKLRISWFGGEPLLCSRQIIRMSKRIVELCRMHKVPIYGEISTNGYCLDVETFQELVKCHITDFQVCLDGLKEFHNQSRPHFCMGDSYQKIIENLKKIKEKNINSHFKIMLRTNVTPQVSGHMKEHIDNMAALFGDDKRFMVLYQCVRDWGGTSISKEQIVESESEQYKELYHYSTEARMEGASSMSFTPIEGDCQAYRKNGYLIDYNAELHKCSLAYHNKETSEINRIGYIDKKGNEVIDQNKIAKWLENSKLYSKECCNCVLYPFCMGGHCPYSQNILRQDNCNRYIMSLLTEHLLQLDFQGKIFEV